MSSNQDDHSLQRAYIAVGGVGLVGAAIGAVWLSVPWALSIALGSCIAVINLYVLARSVQKLLGGGPKVWGLVAVAKFAALLAVTYLAIRSEFVVPLGLALGFGSLPLGILLASLSGPMMPTTSQRNTDHA